GDGRLELLQGLVALGQPLALLLVAPTLHGGRGVGRLAGGDDRDGAHLLGVDHAGVVVGARLGEGELERRDGPRPLRRQAAVDQRGAVVEAGGRRRGEQRRVTARRRGTVAGREEG